MVQPESAVTRFQRERERVGGAGCGGVGGAGVVYMCLHSHQHKQNGSEFGLRSQRSQRKHSEKNLWGG